MKVEVKLDYNDLKLFLTKADLEQIKGFPEPSLEQAKMIKKQWEDHFGKTEIPKTPEAMQNGIIWIKPFLKAFDTYPELWV